MVTRAFKRLVQTAFILNRARFSRAILAVILVVSPASAAAQSLALSRIPSTVSCSACSISVRRVTTLGNGSRAGALPIMPLQVTQDARGRIFAVVSVGDQPVLVYDSTGKFIRVLGRVGDGPGEFRRAWRVDFKGDTIIVFDSRNRRASLFSASFEYRRQFPLFAFFAESLRLPSGNYVGNSSVSSASRSGMPLHFFTETALGKSFGGSDTVVFDPRQDMRERLRFSLSTHGRFWVADELSYVVTQYDTTGRQIRRIARVAEWFPPSPNKIVLPTPTVPPYSRIIAVREDRAGLLWVFTAVADPKWAQGLGPKSSTADGPTGHRWDSYELMFDTQIEVIDTRANRVVSAVRIPELVLASLSENKVAILRDQNGEPVVDVVQINLTTSTRENQ